MATKSSVLRDIRPCAPVKINWRFRSTYRLQQAALRAAFFLLVSYFALTRRWKRFLPPKHRLTFTGIRQNIKLFKKYALDGVQLNRDVVYVLNNSGNYSDLYRKGVKLQSQLEHRVTWRFSYYSSVPGIMLQQCHILPSLLFTNHSMTRRCIVQDNDGVVKQTIRNIQGR
jgi:hypothetical protein